MLKFNSKRKIKFSVVAFLLCGILLGTARPALSDMMFMPIRVLFKDRDRMKTLTVINTSQRTALFRVEFENKRQVERGGYENVTEPLEYDLSKMLVYSPRQVSLEPQGKQSIRISVRRPADLPDGEYRTHVRLKRIPNQEPDTSRGVGAKVGVNVGFSIPVILRKGRHDVTAKISSFKYLTDSSRASAEIWLERSGLHGALGKLDVFWTPAGGEERKVGTLNSVNMFAELNKRVARVILNNPGASGGSFRVVYQGADADKGIVFDEQTFPGP